MAYPELFEELWDTFDTEFGPKGSKTKAYVQFKKLRTDIKEIIAFYNRQLENKRIIRRRAGWTPNFPHVERYLRHERWRDEPEHIPPTTPGWKNYEKPEDNGRTLSPEEKRERINKMREELNL
jgi:hypothetical protein